MHKTLHMNLLLSSGMNLMTLSSGSTFALELELKPAFDLVDSYRIAGICFLPDCEEKTKGIDINISVEDTYCADNGFSYNSSGVCPVYHEKEGCPRDANYIKCDARKWCEHNGYEKVSCTVPEYLSEKCPNGLELYKECKADYKQACENQNPAFTDKCQNGWQLDNTQLCTYSPSYGICCNKCEGFEYTADTVPQGYIIGERCDSCVGARYKKIINPCAGYGDCSTLGPATGSATCWSGTTRKYKTCKVGCDAGYIDWCGSIATDCASLGYTKTASSCPNGGIKCPFDTSKWFCEGNLSCSSDYQYNCSGTGYSGGSGTSCNNKYTSCTCSSGYSWSGGTCVKNASSVQVRGYCCTNATLGSSTNCGSYSYCRGQTDFIDCNIMMNSCKTIGGIPIFQGCPHPTNSGDGIANYECKL